MITKDMTLADVVKAHPNTIGFLNGLHLDYCCGGHEAISIAIREKGMDVDAFLAELNKVAARPTGRIAVRGKPVTIPQGAGSIPAIPSNSPWTPGGIAGHYGNVKRSSILQTRGFDSLTCWCNIVARHGTVGWGKKS